VREVLLELLEPVPALSASLVSLLLVQLPLAASAALLVPLRPPLPLLPALVASLVAHNLFLVPLPATIVFLAVTVLLLGF